MARYRVKEMSFIGHAIVEEGKIVEIDDKTVEIGPNLELVKPGKKRSEDEEESQ